MNTLKNIHTKQLTLLLVCIQYNSWTAHNAQPAPRGIRGKGNKMSTIKINRAAKIAECGKFPRTWQTIIEAIPAEVISAVTAKQLAAMADAMHKQFEAGHTAGYNDAK